MVCNRCIEAVAEELQKLEINPIQIQLGSVLIEKNINVQQKEQLRKGLRDRGFELLEDKTSKIIEQVKSLIINSIHRQNAPIKVNYSTFLKENLNLDYNYVSGIFSSVEGMTIEHFIILQKIEKIKELLVYDELNLSQIAHKLGYSSVQHLSNQFKKNTGMSPSVFRKQQNPKRKPLDQIRD